MNGGDIRVNVFGVMSVNITCPFCQTTYRLDQPESRRSVQCSVCGHVWDSKIKPKSRFNISIRGILIVLSIVFSISMTGFLIINPEPIKNLIESVANNDDTPLKIGLNPLQTSMDENDQIKWLITGSIKNPTDKMFSVPGVNIILHARDGQILDVFSFYPPAPILDSGAEIEFSYTITPMTDMAHHISVIFKSGENK